MSAYSGLSEETDLGRWAFGTGFVDPLAGVDTTVPDGVDPADLAAYCLMLGDDALVLSHRLQQWLTRAPELEEETALANIALDLLGQARLLLTRAGRAEGLGRDEDALAFFRDAADYRNVRLVEPAARDFAALLVQVLVFSTWRLAVVDGLRRSKDPVLAAVAARACAELAYHRDWAAHWVLLLGDGTAESRRRVEAGLDGLAPFVPELFHATDVETRLVVAGVAVDPSALHASVEDTLNAVLAEAGLAWPSPPGPSAGGLGRDGHHTEAMGPLLEELQVVAPGARGGLVVTALGTIRAVAGAVPDPELVPLTIEDLGILREVTVEGGRVVVSLAPTYSACPALHDIAGAVRRALEVAGYPDVELRIALHPAWTSDAITPEGRRKLAAAGIAPPRAAPDPNVTVVQIGRSTRPAAVRCPRCGSSRTAVIAAFGSTACRALHRCQACSEPFERMKER